jgi:hypothetical protein
MLYEASAMARLSWMTPHEQSTVPVTTAEREPYGAQLAVDSTSVWETQLPQS